MTTATSPPNQLSQAAISTNSKTEVANIERQLDLAEKVLDHQLHWIDRFDVKSGVVLPVDTALIGALAYIAAGPLTKHHAFPHDLPLMITVALSALLLVASFLCLFLGNYPQTKGPEPQTKGPKRSLLYFKSIAGRTSKEYEREFMNQTETEYLQDVLQQCHRNAEIVNLKFRYLKWAYGMLFFALPLWVIAIYLAQSASH